MADRYWVGGSGLWTPFNTEHWASTSGGTAGASAPTSTDNVYFDTASSAGAYTVQVDTPANFVLLKEDGVSSLLLEDSGHILQEEARGSVDLVINALSIVCPTASTMTLTLPAGTTTTLAAFSLSATSVGNFIFSGGAGASLVKTNSTPTALTYSTIIGINVSPANTWFYTVTSTISNSTGWRSIPAVQLGFGSNF